MTVFGGDFHATIRVRRDTHDIISNKTFSKSSSLGILAIAWETNHIDASVFE
jgi:hypothetical protein